MKLWGERRVRETAELIARSRELRAQLDKTSESLEAFVDELQAAIAVIEKGGQEDTQDE